MKTVQITHGIGKVLSAAGLAQKKAMKENNNVKNYNSGKGNNVVELAVIFFSIRS